MVVVFPAPAIPVTRKFCAGLATMASTTRCWLGARDTTPPLSSVSLWLSPLWLVSVCWRVRYGARAIPIWARMMVRGMTGVVAAGAGARAASVPRERPPLSPPLKRWNQKFETLKSWNQKFETSH